jgi:hypothetical protein
MPFQSQGKQQIGLAGLMVTPDLPAGLEGRANGQAYFTKLGNRLVYVETKAGHSISKLLAIPDSPDAWMVIPVGSASSIQAQAIAAEPTTRSGTRSRGRATASAT